MYQPKIREEMGVVSPEVRKEFSVFVKPQELTDELDGEDFGVEECGSGSARSERPEILELVVSKRQKTATMKVL